MKKTWYLVNVARIAAENPETFSVPDRQDIEELVDGVWVQLFFASERPGQSTERMWVRVIFIEDLTIVGTLANDPVMVPDLSCGEGVFFQRFHIAKILIDEKAEPI